MKKIITSIALAATILSGCTKNDEPVVTPEIEGVNLEFSATLPETRTYLGEHDANTQNVKVYWSKNDALTVWSNKSEAHIYEISNDYVEPSSTATFIYNPDGPANVGPNGVVGTAFYAVYPHNTDTTVSGNVATINLPDAQVCNSAATTANFEPNYNPMAAAGSDINGLTFHNLCGIIVIDVTPDQDLTVDKIELATKKEVLCGKAQVTFPGTDVEPTIKFTELTKTKLSLICNSVMLEAGKTYPFYLVVPEGTYTYLDINIYTNYDKDLNTSTLHKVRRKSSVTINKNVITRIGANFKLDTVEPEPPHAYAVGDVYPYSKDGSATPVGIVFALDNPTTTNGVATGTSGKIISLTKIDGTYALYTGAAKEDGEIINNSGFAGSRTNGMLNLTRAINVNPELSDFPAFKKVQEVLGNDWYIPAINELAAIIDNKTELENHWKDARKDQNTSMIGGNGTKCCSSTITGGDGWWYTYYYQNSRSNWTQKQGMLNNAEPDPETPTIVYVPAYSVIAISTFNSENK